MTSLAALAHRERRLEEGLKKRVVPVGSRIIICPRCKGDMVWEPDMLPIGGSAGPGHDEILCCINCGMRL